MDLSIIIVNFNTKKLTENCIDSILQTTRCPDFEIIVVDNSTNPDCKYQIKDNHKNRVVLIDNVENKGFGNACNIGAKKAKGDYILLINSDIIVHRDTIDKSLDYIKKYDDVGVVGVKIKLTNNTLEHGCKRGFPTPWASFCYFTKLDRLNPKNKKFGAYRQTFIDEDTTAKVDAVSGSYMLIDKNLYGELGGFDEDFFMYGEDLDLCYRISKLGKKIVYYADVSATHLKGQSGLSHKNPSIIYHFYNAMRIFYKKHYQKKYNPLVNFLVLKAIDIKYALAKKNKS